MTTSRPPSFATLVSWVGGRLDKARADEVTDHVADSPDAQASVEWIRGFIQAGRDMPLVTPPPSVGDRAREAFRRRITPWSPSDHLDASLIFDSRDYPLASGMRSTDADTSTLLIFEVDQARIELDIIPTGDAGIEAHGFAVWEGATDQDQLDITLSANQTARHTAHCGPGGAFHIDSVETDVDELWLTNGDRSVRAAIPAGAFGNT